MMRRLGLLAISASLLTFLSACGGSNSSGTGKSPTATPTATPTASITVTSPNALGFVTVIGSAGVAPGEGIITAADESASGSSSATELKAAEASSCTRMASVATNADGSFSVSVCGSIGNQVEVDFEDSSGQSSVLGDVTVSSTAAPSTFTGNPCAANERQLLVSNSTSQALWVSGGGGALRSVCVVNNGASSCLAAASTINAATGSCQCGTSIGSLACPGISNPIGPKSAGLNCQCQQDSDCGPGAGCNLATNLCYFTLPSPTEFLDFTPDDPWNWELPTNAAAVNFCLTEANVTYQPAPSPGAAPSSTAIPSAVWWSGGLGARTGCQADGTSCLTGDCNTSVSSNGGKPVPNADCPVGVGGAQPATIAEFTLQRSATDFYDITVINGANIGEQMGPIPTATQTPNGVDPAYWCATPGGDCNFDFGQYTKSVPIPSATQTTDYTTLLMLIAKPCAVGTGNPPAGQAPTGCPLFADPAGVAYSCSGNAKALNGVCYKTCSSDTQCPSGLHCLQAGDGNSYCQCSAQSDCPAGQFCGSQLVPGLGSATLSPQVYLRQCGSFEGWWTADDFCANANNLIGSPGSPALNCGAGIIDGDSTKTNLASLLGCNGASSAAQAGNPANEQSCYNANADPTTGCCGCATDAANPLSTLWPAATGSCASNNTTWAADVQPWLANLKEACPSAYTYAYDDFTSTFQCQAQGAVNMLGYQIDFTSLPVPASE